MKIIFYSLILASAGTIHAARHVFPTLGNYQFHEKIKGDCLGMGVDLKRTLHFTFNEWTKIYRIFLKENSSMNSAAIETLAIHDLNFHRTHPSDRFHLINEGRTLHVVRKDKQDDLVVEAHFEFEGNFLFLNFKKIKEYNKGKPGKCLLKRITND